MVVTTESVMLKRIHRRINDRPAEAMLYSDNQYRRSYPLDESDITELWGTSQPFSPRRPT